MITVVVMQTRILLQGVQLEQSTKTGPDRFSNFMSPGLAKSVPGPVVTNNNKICRFSCS